MKDGHAWFDAFVAEGPEYVAQRMSVAELQALLLKAGIGSDLPLGHAQDLSALSTYLMTDPKLVATAAAALTGHHYAPAVEGTDDHLVIERAKVLMACPMMIDMMVAGTKRVILHDLDWPILLWPYLAQAQKVYDLCVKLDRTDPNTVMVSVTDKNTLDPFGPQQPVPISVIERLQEMAAKTYVPATEASRVAGAGAGLTDND